MALVDVRPAPEFGIVTFHGGRIEVAHGGAEGFDRNADLVSQPLQASCALEVAGFYGLAHRECKRLDAAKAVLPQEVAIADEPCRDRGLRMAQLRAYEF